MDESAQPRFAGAKANRAEIGVLDRWVSLGAVDLGPPPFHDLATALAGHDAGRVFLASALPAPLILEVTVGSAGDGW